MNTAKEVDEALSKLWPNRGWTRGLPKWEKKIALAAVTELTEAGEESKILALGNIGDGFHGTKPIAEIIGYKPEEKS